MTFEKSSKRNCKNEQKCKCKDRNKTGNIKGKIEISDNRERRDGPGGN